VWIDQELYARVRSRVRQLGLEGEVLSNDETNSFQAVDQYGRPAAWTRDSFVLPVHTVGQQLLSVINKTTQLELEAELTEIRINGADFAHRLSAAHASDVAMVRDTRKGFLPLVKDDTGRRVVDEGEATSRIFIIAGLSIDDARDFPVPLAGINYLSFDFLGSGAQFSVFFAGALADIDLAWPRFAGSRWNLGGRLEVTALARTDERFRNGEEVPGEELERRRQRFEITAGRPFGSYTKLDLTYRLEHATFDDKESTSEEFLLPRDVLTETFTTDLSYLRSGYRAGARWAASRRDRWQRWGLPTDTEFSPDHREYNRWRLSLAKSWWLPLLTKFGVELQHQGGSDLDRFSKFGFSSLGDSQTQAERSSSVRVVYGFDLGDFVRLEAGGRAAWVVDRQAGLDNALVAGFNINGTVPGPIGTLMNIELRAPVETPGAARHVSARIIFLKLLGGR